MTIKVNLTNLVFLSIYYIQTNRYHLHSTYIIIPQSINLKTLISYSLKTQLKSLKNSNIDLLCMFMISIETEIEFRGSFSLKISSYFTCFNPFHV